MTARLLKEFRRLEYWWNRSETFFRLYGECSALGITLDDTSNYREDLPVAEQAHIYLRGINRWKHLIRANDIVILSHEMQHAVQDHSKGGVWGEVDAYRVQEVVIDELKANGFAV